MSSNNTNTVSNAIKYIEVYNLYHIGDILYATSYLNNNLNYILDNNIVFIFYYNPNYINTKTITQIKEFIQENTIKFVPAIREVKGINLWIGTKEHEVSVHTHGHLPFNELLVNFYKCVSTKLNFPIVDSILYTDNELLIRYNNIINKYPNKYNKLDILVINSIPMSGQYNNYNLLEWENMLNILSKKYKLVTTYKVNNTNCTLDDDLTLKDIGAISTQVTYIIAINTGPVVPCLNTFTMNNIKKMYVFDNNMKYSYHKLCDTKSTQYVIDDLM